jgi:3-deoxy-D-manno-octulosonate 8-phosphate phosphatase (KDO 8-P phosphatase)
MIRLLVLDVDGCMTDGSITYSNSGEEYKSFNVKDGLAISSWIKMGRKCAIITGRESNIVEKRAKELGVNYLFQGVKSKILKLDEILKKENFDYRDVAIMGDDLNDYNMLKIANWSFAPNDGNYVIKELVDTVLETSGGKGAVREMIEEILKKEGAQEELLKLWL